MTMPDTKEPTAPVKAEGDDAKEATPPSVPTIPPTPEAEEAEKPTDDSKPADEVPAKEEDDAKAADDDAKAAAAAPQESTTEPSPDLTFPQQLMDVIEKESTEGKSFTDAGERVLEWNEDGTGFLIRDKGKLEREVLPGHFSARCKFMSFVRKLYRWGFRQVEKQSPGVMTFTHTHFVRGDKKRCLYMRSIVKRQGAGQSAQAGQQQPAFTGSGLAANQAALQAVYGGGMGGGMGGDYFRMGPGGYGGGMGMGMGRPGMFPPSMSDRFMGGMGGNMDSRFMGGSGGMPGMMPGAMGGGMMPSDPMMSGMGQYPPGRGAGGPTSGMTSSELFEASLRLRRMEQMEHALGPGTGSPGGMPPAPGGMPSGYGRGGGSPKANFGGGGGKDEIELASEMMRRDPGMEPRRALELARSIHQKHQ